MGAANPSSAWKAETAQQVTLALAGDLNGGPADQTVWSGFESADYEIDLSSKNAQAFPKQLTPFIEHARKAGRGLAGRAARTTASRQRHDGIRAWATDHGIAVSERGRIPARVVEQYQADARLTPTTTANTERDRQRSRCCACRIGAADSWAEHASRHTRIIQLCASCARHAIGPTRRRRHHPQAVGLGRRGCGMWTTTLTPPPSPPRPQTPGRHDERGMGTSNWPPAETFSAGHGQAIDAAVTGRVGHMNPSWVNGMKGEVRPPGGSMASGKAMGDMPSPSAVGGSSAGGQGISVDDGAESGTPSLSDEYLSAGPATRPGPHTQDLRVAVAMTGGVSLAVWIGGVARELNLLQQAAWLRESAPDGGPFTDAGDTADADHHVRTRYLQLINLLDVTVSIDILSGTGAGGINAALLGMARARPCDLGPLRDMWLEAGAFETLLRDPTERSPPSLLHGDLLLDRLCSEMRKLGDKPPPVQPPPGACGPGSSNPETRVFITTTLLTGETSRFTDDAGTLVQDVDHRGLFVFNEADLADPRTYDALALAARSSASFPVAFEPAFVAHNEIPARRRGPRHPAMAKYANITRAHWAADGGLLMNRPINPLLRAIFDRAAERQVRRILLYVVPSPGDPAAASETSAEVPPTFGEALFQELSAVLNQSISADLKALREHNDRVDSLRVTRVRMAELGVRLRQAAGEQPGTVPAGLVTT